MSKLKITHSKRDITPRSKIGLGGSVRHSKIFDKVDLELEINGVAIFCKRSTQIMVSVDTLSVTDDLKRAVLDQLKNQYQIQEENLFIGATHTHNAPLINDKVIDLGIVDKEYSESVIAKITELCEELLSNEPEAIDIEYSKQECDKITVNRRKKSWIFWRNFIPRRGMMMYPNPDKYSDKNSYLIKFRSEKAKKVLCVIWCFACHPVSYHTMNNVTSGFSGEVRASIRKTLKNNVSFLYFQGFSGDVRPLSVAKPKSWQEKIQKVLNKQAPFTDFSKQTYKDWINKLIVHISEQFKDGGRVQAETVSSEIKRLPVEKILASSIHYDDIIFHRVSIGEKLSVIGISAEIMSEVSLWIKDIVKEKEVIPMGCVNDMFGYLPTDKMVREGGYESKGFKKYFFIKGEFRRKKIDGIVKKAIKRVFSISDAQ